jgi:1-acyl-sn-glycerol-3-phosphate acyltransferase
MSNIRKVGWFKRVFYNILKFCCRIVGVLFYGLRCYGRENLPHNSSGLVLSTHQSNFDPVLVGLAFNERLNYLARRTLFKNRFFAGFIRLLDAIELDRDRSGLAGLKETLQRLEANGKVLIFPEGTRTGDGQIQPLKPGFLAVARRSQAPLIPVTIIGAFEALPRGRVLPRRVPLRVSFGKPIHFSDYQSLSDDETLALVSSRLKHSYRQAEILRRLD